jgi:hypothetical protein
MTTVGKILVVLHLFLSVMFMAFAGAVYTAQNNWRAAEAKTAAALAKANSKIKDMTAEFELERADLTQKVAGLNNRIQDLTGQKIALTAQVTTLDSDNRQLRKDVDQQRDQSALTTTEAIERKKEADLQREKNGELFKSREELVGKLNEVNDKLFAGELLNQQISEKYDLLLNDFKTMKSYLASKDLTTDPKQMIGQSAPPPLVDGLVTEVRKSAKGSRELVEISLGSDDGLVVGNKLTVYSGDKYLGVIRLTLVQADKSVGFVDIPTRAKNATFNAGDTVTTRF